MFSFGDVSGMICSEGTVSEQSPDPWILLAFTAEDTGAPICGRLLRDYITYLQAAGELIEEVESSILEGLQGAQGLHALRVTVAMPPPHHVLYDHADESLDADWPALRAV